MLPANRHFLPVIGIDIHIVIILGVPVPMPHPFIGLVFDPMDWIPFIGSTVNVNSMPRGNAGTTGMLGCKVHIPMGGPFAMPPIIGHESRNFFGSPRVIAQGSYFSGAGYMVMSCNDIGIPLSLSPGKKIMPVPSLYLPTSVAIPIPAGPPVIVGGPYVPDVMGMLTGLAMSLGFGAVLKGAGAAARAAMKKANKLKGILTKGLAKVKCILRLEPVNLITGAVLYEGCDFELPGIIPVKWERSWYSDSAYQGPLGHGMHLSYDLSLHMFEEDQSIGIILPDGRAADFPLLLTENGKFYNRTEKLTLTCKNCDCYELFDHNNQLLYVFERLHKNVFRPKTLSDISGAAIKFFYNRRNCLHKIIDTAGREILMSHDASDRITKVEAQHKGLRRNLVEYAYNDAGDLSAITDAKGQTTSLLYRNHLMVENTDRNGQTFYWEYDGFSTGARCIHTWGDGGLLEGFIRYEDGRHILTNSLGEDHIYYYDDYGLCVQETDPLGNSVFHEYTEFMELYRDIDEEGNITGYVYDARGNMTARQLPDGSALHFLYDQEGRLKMETDAEGHSTVYVYKEGLLKAVVAADGHVASYSYNAIGVPDAITDGKSQVTHLQYDEDHNLARIILPDGAQASWQYDAWGRCLTAINPERQSQQFSYDLLDRVTHIRKSDGNKVELRYNAYEEVVYVQDAHHKVSFEYSPLGSLKAREENGTRLEFHRDTEDRLVFLLNEHREAYRFRYDKRGMVIEEKGFDGIKRQFVRDAAGKIIRVNRLGGRFADYEYDLAGRLTRVEYSDGSWQVYSYDKNGNLVEAQNENSQVFIERDAAGRVIKEIQDGHVVESRYDKLGRRMEVKTSLGASIKMERDKAGFVSRMSADRQGENWEAQFTYNALGQETGRVLPGGIASSFSYDRGGRPESHTVTNGSRILRNRIYSWNVNDRLQSMMNGLSRGIVHYGHDDFGNLAWARYEDKQYDYRLPDKVGNLYRTPERSDRKYGAGGRLLQSRGVKYEYDEEGQLVSKSSSGGQWLYRWSGNGMLKSVMRPDGREVSFEYDGLGRRTAKIFNNRITRWVWDGNRPLHEWNYALEARPKTIVDEFGDVTQDNPEPLDGMISWLFDEGTFRPAAKLQEGVVQSIITDYLGTPVEMYDAEGRQTWSVEYDIYGKIRKQILGKFAECPFRYQGQYEDEETGLYYNRFRYYDSSSGTYLSQDPIGLSGGMAFYGYVRDPNAWVDILGLNCSAAQRKANKSSGKKAEDLVHNKLQNNPDVEVLGRQVTVHTSEGVRYVDVLIRNKKTGKVIAVEVKGGRAKRNSNQISKDKIINNGGGTFGSSGFSNPDNPLIGTSTTNTTTSVTQVPSWKL